MQNTYLADSHVVTRRAFARLIDAISKNRSIATCHKIWSHAIRTRDNNRCVSCHSTNGLSAHHICRKSFLPSARFNPGNGITLCSKCHRVAHRGFNGRPNLHQPMDMQGGEKIDILCNLFYLLIDDARSRKILGDEFYFLSDHTIQVFKRLQGFAFQTDFPGCRLEQAALIWHQTPLAQRNALLLANGVESTSMPFLPGVTVFFD